MNLHFNKIFNFDRSGVTSITVPFKKGYLFGNNLIVKNEKGEAVTSDVTALESYEDGSVSYAKVDFLYDIKANKTADYSVETGKNQYTSLLEDRDNTVFISSGKINFQASRDSSKLFTQFSYNKRYLTTKDFIGPNLIDSYGHVYTYAANDIRIIKSGAVSSSICVLGTHSYNDTTPFESETYFTLYKDSSIIDIDFKITNVSNNPIQIQSLSFEFVPSYEVEKTNNFIFYSGDNKEIKGTDGEITFEIDKEKVEAHNEVIIPETYVNTFMADYCDENLGVSAVIKSAFANYPSTFSLSKKGLKIFLIPKTPIKIVIKPQISKDFNFSLLFHSFDEEDIVKKEFAYSYELKDIPYIEPKDLKDLFNITFDNEFAKKVYATKRSYGKMTFGQDFSTEELMKSLNNYYTSGERCFLDVFKAGAKYYSCHMNTDSLSDYYFADVLINYYYLTGNTMLLDNIKKLIEVNKETLNKESLSGALHFNCLLYKVTKDENLLENAGEIFNLINEWSKTNEGFTVDYNGIALITKPHILLNISKALDEYQKTKPQKETQALLTTTRTYLEKCKLACGDYYISDFPNQIMTFGGIQ